MARKRRFYVRTGRAVGTVHYIAQIVDKPLISATVQVGESALEIDDLRRLAEHHAVKLFFEHVAVNFAFSAENVSAAIKLIGKRGHRERCRAFVLEQHIDNLMIDDVVVAMENATGVRIRFIR